MIITEQNYVYTLHYTFNHATILYKHDKGNKCMQKIDFNYMRISKSGVLEENGYIATISQNGFITLRTLSCDARLKETGANPPGWKLHISVDDENENLIRAWDSIAEVFINHQLSFVKVQLLKNIKDTKGEAWDCGRQFTIYMHQNPEKQPRDWQNLINEITAIFVREDIRPGYTNPTSKPIEGSSYFSYKNDTRPKQDMKQDTKLEKKSSMEDLTTTLAHSPPASMQTSKNISDDKSDSKSKPKVTVPFLRLSNAPPKERKQKETISCRDIYLGDYPKEKWYNPSNGEDRY